MPATAKVIYPSRNRAPFLLLDGDAITGMTNRHSPTGSTATVIPTPAAEHFLRARHTVADQVQLAAELVVDWPALRPRRGGSSTPARPRKHGLPVPLVLLEGMYRPFSDRVPPISGIAGDVKQPSNIIWPAQRPPRHTCRHSIEPA